MSSAILLLRTAGLNGESYNGFRWPLEVGAVVEAKDWNPKPECGHGLHGLPWGEGDGSLLQWESDSKWLVIEADAADVVEILDPPGKSKCRKCVIRHVGDQASATKYLAENGAFGRAIVGGTATAGDGGTATAGHRGTATAGDVGAIILYAWDDDRYRLIVGMVGKDGIEPNVRYRLNEKLEFVKAVS